jgi:hypothetical protein
MTDRAASRTTDTLSRFAAATGRPIAPEYLERVSEAYWLLVDGLDAIPAHDLLEIEPTVTFRVAE